MDIYSQYKNNRNILSFSRLGPAFWTLIRIVEPDHMFGIKYGEINGSTARYERGIFGQL